MLHQKQSKHKLLTPQKHSINVPTCAQKTSSAQLQFPLLVKAHFQRTIARPEQWRTKGPQGRIKKLENITTQASQTPPTLRWPRGGCLCTIMSYSIFGWSTHMWCVCYVAQPLTSSIIYYTRSANEKVESMCPFHAMHQHKTPMFVGSLFVVSPVSI